MRNGVKLIGIVVWAIVSLMVVQTAAAETWVYSGGRYVTTAYPHNAGFRFALDGAILNSGSCSSTGNNLFNIQSTDPNYYAKVSGILTAFAEHKSVNILYDEDSTDCFTPVERFQIFY